jgi:hypothetical protein
MVLEDLGSKDLHAFSGEDWPVRRVLYQKTLTAARRLHAISEKDFPSERVKLMEGFGPELYRFEQDYFLENFVRNHCDMVLDTAFESRLMSELSRLTDDLCSPQRCLVHRDLQSQNVMVPGSEPYFIDFQGMRFGNPFYDLGSLLCDPYVFLTPGEREDSCRSTTSCHPRNSTGTHSGDRSGRRLCNVSCRLWGIRIPGTDQGPHKLSRPYPGGPQQSLDGSFPRSLPVQPAPPHNGMHSGAGLTDRTNRSYRTYWTYWTYRTLRTYRTNRSTAVGGYCISTRPVGPICPIGLICPIGPIFL